MRVMELFAGCGGGILGHLILGHEVVAAIEKDPDRCRVLRYWFPDLEVVEADVREVDYERWAGEVDCISAGFPCQDISIAGTGAGLKGKRSGLFWEVIRAIDAVRPGCVFFENSPAIRKRGRVEVVRAFVERGYSWRDGTLAASHVGAPHKRSRWWFLATDPDGKRKLEQERIQSDEWGRPRDGYKASPDVSEVGRREIETWEGICCEGWWEKITGGFESSPDPCRQGLERDWWEEDLRGFVLPAIQAVERATGSWGWNPAHPHLRGMVHGLPSRVDGRPFTKKSRIGMLGDAQVPLQMAAAWLLLTEVKK